MRSIILQLSLVVFLTSGWSAPALASGAGNPDAIAIERAGIVYTARAGDTLSSIAGRFTTKTDNWTVLGKINNIDKDTAIPIGARIAIPADLLQDELTEAKVIALSGSITASSPEGKPVRLGLGAQITEGMQIDTGNNSFLTLLLPDQSRISLPSNSRIRIAKLRMALYTKSPRTEILLLNGKIESKVAPLEQNKGRFEVRTPLAVAGVRGTNFRVAIGQHGTTTEVLSGKVEVARPNRSDPQMLENGQGNLVTQQSVGKPVKLLPAPQLSQVPQRLDADGTGFALKPVAGARRYHVQVSTDREAHNILAEAYAGSTRLRIDGLPKGSYFARVSAIDKAGLEGFSSIHAFTLETAAQAMPELDAPGAPSIEGGQSRQLTLRWQGAPGHTYKLQVARDPAFSWLVYNAKASEPQARMTRPAFGTYYARVQTIGPRGTASPFSLAQPFVVTEQWVIHDGAPISSNGVAATTK